VQVQSGPNPQFLDLKHGIVALFFVEFVRLVQGYNQFVDDFRSQPPRFSGFMDVCKAQQRLRREEIRFLEKFLRSQVWAQYLYELERVQQWLGFGSDADENADVPSISQEWGLPVALFHELCGRASRRHDIAVAERQRGCFLCNFFRAQRS